MQTEAKKPFRKELKIAMWCVVAVYMGIIFYFSSRTADESSLQSGFILEFLTKLFGDGVFTTFIVRKSAHFLEYMGLGFLFSAAFYVQFGKLKFVFPVLGASLYAVTDEVHQLFVEGRSCQVSDWALDSVAGILGMVAFLIIFAVVTAIMNRKSKKAFDSDKE